ncbi:MAG: cytidylate kinase family protein [Pseudonocardiaceae bacterium]
MISGLTAAGKTTHGKLLAEDLGWAYFDIASVRKSILGNKLDAAERYREWTPAHDKLRAADPSIDLRADHLMTRIMSERANVVVDAWLQPWIYRRDDALRIWIESSAETRLMKAEVAALRRGEAVSCDIRNSLAAKDEFSRIHFHRLYSIELFGDPSVFSVLIDNSEYIDEPSIAKSDAGIAAFRQVLLEHVIEEFGHARGTDGS